MLDSLELEFIELKVDNIKPVIFLEKADLNKGFTDGSHTWRRGRWSVCPD
jgi:hypothetical protein